MQQQIVEINGVRLQQPFPIGGIDLLDDRIERLPFLGYVRFGRHQIVLRPTDRVGNGLGTCSDQINVAFLDREFQRFLAVVSVVDGVVRVQAHQRSVASQQPSAERMERAHPHAAAGDQTLDARPHFVRGLVGESQRQHTPRRDPLLEHVGDAMRDDSRLAAAWSGQDQERPVDVPDRLLLWRSE